MKSFWNFIVLALIGGFIGLQEFYRDRSDLGVVAVLFCWTGIPALVAFIEAAVWLFRGEEEFNMCYRSEGLCQTASEERSTVAIKSVEVDKKYWEDRPNNTDSVDDRILIAIVLILAISAVFVLLVV